MFCHRNHSLQEVICFGSPCFDDFRNKTIIEHISTQESRVFYLLFSTAYVWSTPVIVETGNCCVCVRLNDEEDAVADTAEEETDQPQVTLYVTVRGV